MRASPATVIACAALLVSLSGNALAVRGLITSKQIKNGTIQLVDLSPSLRHTLSSQPTQNGSNAVLAERVSGLESFKNRLCTYSVVSDVRLVPPASNGGLYTLMVNRVPCY